MKNKNAPQYKPGLYWIKAYDDDRFSPAEFSPKSDCFYLLTTDKQLIVHSRDTQEAVFIQAPEELAAEGWKLLEEAFLAGRSQQSWEDFKKGLKNETTT